MSHQQQFQIVAWEYVADRDGPLAVFRFVFWQPRATARLRRLIRTTSLVCGKTVLEISTGTGLIALCCLKAGAAGMAANDINPAAVANARYNAQLLGYSDRIELPLVPTDLPEAFSVIEPSERFDLIISNPPGVDACPRSAADYALYDHGLPVA